MRAAWRRAILSAVCSLTACGRGTSVTNETQGASCEGKWWLTVRPPVLEVGATAIADVTLFTTTTAHMQACARQVVSVEWSTSVPGIVSFEPSGRPDQAVVTGEIPGETEMGAEIDLGRGLVVTALFINETVRVVPAPGLD